MFSSIHCYHGTTRLWVVIRTSRWISFVNIRIGNGTLPYCLLTCSYQNGHWTFSVRFNGIGSIFHRIRLYRFLLSNNTRHYRGIIHRYPRTRISHYRLSWTTGLVIGIGVIWVVTKASRLMISYPHQHSLGNGILSRRIPTRRVSITLCIRSIHGIRNT